MPLGVHHGSDWIILAIPANSSPRGGAGLPQLHALTQMPVMCLSTCQGFSTLRYNWEKLGFMAAGMSGVSKLGSLDSIRICKQILQPFNGVQVGFHLKPLHFHWSDPNITSLVSLVSKPCTSKAWESVWCCSLFLNFLSMPCVQGVSTTTQILCIPVEAWSGGWPCYCSYRSEPSCVLKAAIEKFMISLCGVSPRGGWHAE